MYRWESVPTTEIFDMVVRMYREPFVAEKKQKVVFERVEMDYYAYKHLGSDLLMYMVLDTNWTEYMEARGDVNDFETIYVPSKEKIT
jgi:hypothetical protein